MILYESFRSHILPLTQIDQALPLKGVILDLGCGEGVITKYLAQIKTRKIIGIDSDKKRVSAINTGNISFKVGDIRKIPIRNVDGVVTSDVLHHLSKNEQIRLLQKIFVGLRKNGVLVIKEIDTNEFVRSKLSRFWDFILYPKDKISYWDSNELTKYLKSLGFIVKKQTALRLFPGSTNLYICRK